ncbi:hypothetical protein [Absidia glauca]|uniref:Mid2 domain-containing protein n=1 Tax=Absidia glauca TaxID=4829 RepID=A0A168QK86_ABSGL|nr:hypothetical protein [Absidia glauca]
MISLLPLQSVILVLLLLNFVFCLDVSNQRLKRDSASSRAPLHAREDYSNFNLTDHHNSNDSSEPTKTNKYPRLQQPPSVTTIIIIQTSNGQTYHELGGGTSPTTSSSNDGVGDPNGGDVNAVTDHDNKVLKRIISITTVVGGVGIVLIIAGTVLFVRMRSKQRRMKLIQQCQLPSSSIISGTHGSGNDTNHQRNQSSSSSSSASPSNPQDDEEAIEMTSTTSPSAPPETIFLPDHSRSRLLQSLQLQTLIPPSSSTFSPPTASATPAPSAPSAKELELSSSPPALPLLTISSPLGQQPLLPPSSTYDQDSPDTTHSISESSPSSPSPSSPSSPLSPASPLSSSSSSSSRATPALHLKSMAGTPGSNSTDQIHPPPTLTPELPPPAYTPSAPPLFALPPSRRRRSADELSLDRYKRNL